GSSRLDVRPLNGDRGAALVEFALVFPILAMLLFGLFSAGLAWNDNLALAQGARIGGRYAATLPTKNYTSLDDYLDAVAARVVDASEGSLATSVAGRMLCVAYVHPSGSTTLDQTRGRTETGTTVTRNNSSCFTDNQTSSDQRIQVVAERSATFETGIWSQSITLHQQLVFRYEVTSGL
ncbi:MAG TPA: TadE/TadG family type IV pilus assembly protein, partial [Acidimicrobiales bacterium]|nr:TadE/TadG family type IV pilus assembly protein [Acidimicrobiales bacterium]